MFTNDTEETAAPIFRVEEWTVREKGTIVPICSLLTPAFNLFFLVSLTVLSLSACSSNLKMEIAKHKQVSVSAVDAIPVS